MSQSLEKDQEFNLTEAVPTIKRLHIGFGWTPKPKVDDFGGTQQKPEDFDLDASVFLLNVLKMIRSETDFVFYNNANDGDEAVTHLFADGASKEAGEKQAIKADLSKLPYDVQTLSFSVTLHNAIEKRQGMDMVEDIFIRIADDDNGQELCRFTVARGEKDTTGMTIGEVNRIGPQWVYTASSKPLENGLFEVATAYDVNIRGV